MVDYQTGTVFEWQKKLLAEQAANENPGMDTTSQTSGQRVGGQSVYQSDLNNIRKDHYRSLLEDHMPQNCKKRGGFHHISPPIGSIRSLWFQLCGTSQHI